MKPSRVPFDRLYYAMPKSLAVLLQQPVPLQRFTDGGLVILILSPTVR
jgi:hypothetical protein